MRKVYRYVCPVQVYGLSADIGLLLGRLAFGAMMAFGHGWGKVMDFGQLAEQFDPIGLGPRLSVSLVIFAEFFCAILIMVGLMTRLAAIPLVINMFVAGVIVHLYQQGDPFAGAEMALLFLAGFLVILFTGAGRFSMDYAVCGRRRGA